MIDVSGKYFYKTEEREFEIPNLASDTTERLLLLADELTGDNNVLEGKT